MNYRTARWCFCPLSSYASYIIDFDAMVQCMPGERMYWYCDSTYEAWGLGDPELDHDLHESYRKKAEQRRKDYEVQYWTIIRDHLVGKASAASSSETNASATFDTQPPHPSVSSCAASDQRQGPEKSCDTLAKEH